MSMCVLQFSLKGLFMPSKISNSIGQYINVVRRIEERKPNFQRNMAANLTYGIESLAQVNNDKAFQKIIEKINEAPHSLYKTFSSILLAHNPKSIQELQEYRKSLKVICRKNPDAKEFLTEFRDFLLNNPENKKLIDFIGKGSKNYISAYLQKRAVDGINIRPHANEFLTVSKRLLDDLSDKSLRNHLRNFFDYILNNGASKNAN